MDEENEIHDWQSFMFHWNHIQSLFTYGATFKLEDDEIVIDGAIENDDGAITNGFRDDDFRVVTYRCEIDKLKYMIKQIEDDMLG